MSPSARLLGSSTRREGNKLTALRAAISLSCGPSPHPPNIVRSSVANLIGDVARHVAATVCNTYARIYARLVAVSSALATCRRHYSPTRIYTWLVIASSAALAVAIDLT